MADWTFSADALTAIRTGVLAGFSLQDKIAGFLSTLRTLFSGTCVLELTRNGATISINLFGQPSVVGDSLRWEPGVVSFTAPSALDIATGTWSGRIRSPAGHIAYARSVGVSTGTIRVASSFAAGVQTLLIGPIVITVTSEGMPTSPGGSGSTDLTFTIEDLVYEMTGPNDTNPGAMINLANWGARVFAGYTFDGYPGGANSLFPWFEFYPPHPDVTPWTASAPNSRLDLRNFRVYRRDGATWNLVLQRNGPTGWYGNHFFDRTSYGIATRDVDPIGLTDGIAQPANQLGIVDAAKSIWHGFPDGGVASTGSTSVIYCVCFDAKLSLIDPGGTDDRANVKIDGHAAADWYNGGSIISEAFHARSKRVTNNWQRFAAVNMTVTKNGSFFPGALSEAELRANPPPILTTASSGGSFVPGTPPSGYTTVLSASDTPIALPAGFSGWHRSLNLARDSGSPGQGFTFKVARTWDIADEGLYGADFTWAQLEPGFKGNGRAAAKARLRRFVDMTPGCTRIWTFGLSPAWAAKRSVPQTIWPNCPNGAAPPQNNQDAADFVQWVFTPEASGGGGFTSADFPYVELWNEPNFGAAGGDQYLTPTQDEFLGGQVLNNGAGPEAARSPGRELSGSVPGNIFFYGTPRELATLGRAIKAVLPSTVKLCGCGWEDDASAARWMEAFFKADAGGGQKGIDVIDMDTWHSYMYGNAVQNVRTQAIAYKAKRAQFATELGRTGVASRPFGQSECGYEHPGPATDFSEAQVATTLKRAIAYSAMYGASFHVSYIDRTLADGDAGNTFLNPSAQSRALIKAAQNDANWFNGKVLRQAAYNPSTNQVWCRADDNTEFGPV
ncbi:MAG: hypothetical protein AB7P21_00235 [Lautropia sp.]